MDVDFNSPHHDLTCRSSLACSPGLEDLFEEAGVDALSPEPVPLGNKKRFMEDPDSSFASNVDDSPVGAKSNPNTFSRITGGRIIHRATSAASLNAASRRRGSGISNGGSVGASSSNFLAAVAALNTTAESSSENMNSNGSGRHRKMSRGVDGRPSMLNGGRRAVSMCDSEFYASPPLETDIPSQQEYFGQQHTTGVNDLLAPPDVLSPARPQKNSALNSYQPSPEASFTSGFGCKEAHGKILPCQSVTEDGLMRITASTVKLPFSKGPQL